MEELLNGTGTTIQNILEEDQVIVELKNSNQKLIQFLDEPKLQTVLNYIITVPTDLKNRNECYKFPYVSSQLLSTDNKHIMDFFIKPDAEELTEEDKFKNFKTLLEFVNQEEVNYTLAGYFMKVSNMIILAKPLESLKYIFENKEILTNMKNHIYSKSISSLLMFILNTRSDTLVKVVSATNTEEFFKPYNDTRVALIKDLYKMCSENAGNREKFEMHLSSAIIINHTLQNVETIADGHHLIEKIFETDEYLKMLIDTTYDESIDDFGSIGQVIANIINLANKQENPTQLKIYEYLRTHMCDAIVKYGAIFKNIVDGNSANSIYTSTGGAAFRRFGKRNYKILEILIEFIQFDFVEDIDKAFEQSGFPKILLELMTAFPWHSLMHNACVKLFTKIMESYPLSRAQLFDDDAYVFGVLARVSENGLKHRKHKNSDKQFSMGYLGQLKAISRLLEKQEEDGKIDLSENTNWQKWKDAYFTEQKEIEARDLGGVRVRQNTEVDLESSFDFSIEEIRSRFSDFLNPSADVSIDGESGTEDESSNGQNVDQWLRDILPSNTDELEENDPDYNTTTFFKETIKVDEVDDLLAELE